MEDLYPSGDDEDFTYVMEVDDADDFDEALEGGEDAPDTRADKHYESRSAGTPGDGKVF